LQVAVVEFARNVCGLDRANSTEFDPQSPEPVICLLDEQKGVTSMGGTMRLGAFPCDLKNGTLASDAYEKKLAYERHRHRYEFNNAYLRRFREEGMVFAGTCRKNKLVEIVELKNHPFFIATQFHPEFQSKPFAAHPLFTAFIRSCMARRKA
jgi:CTP synthase